MAASDSPRHPVGRGSPGLLEVSRLPHPVLVNLEPFIGLLQTALTDHWCHLHDTSDDKLYLLLERFLWLERFVAVCRTPLKLSIAEFLIPNLALHWGWVAAEVLPHLLPCAQDSGASTDLLAVVRHLEAELGVDSAASARHQALWSRAGHPHPYRSDRATSLAKRLEGLLRLLHHPEKLASHKTECARLRCMLHEGLTIAGIVLRVGCGVLAAGPDDDLDDLEESLSQFESIFTRHALHDPAAPSAHQSTSEDMPTTTEAMPISRHDLALWPLYEVLSLRTQHYLTGKLAMGNPEPEVWANLSRFINFASSHLCGSPTHLVAMQALLEANDKGAALQCSVPELLTQLTWRHLTSAATTNPDRWLAWSPPTEEDMADAEPNVHKCMYSNLLTHAVMGLLVAPPGSKQTNSTLPSNISLGEMSGKTSQLEALTATLWMHMASFTSPDWDPMCIDSLLVVGTLERLFTAICECFKDNQQPCEIIDSLIVHLQSRGCASLDSGDALSQLNVYDVLLPNFVEVTHATLVAMQPLLHQMSNGRANYEDTVQGAFDNGKAMLHVGFLQSFLLAPQGPVDSAEKKALQLEYARQELANMSKELEVRHEWSRMTLGSGLDLSSSDLHPRVMWLVERKHQLEADIVELGRDVATRPHPPQFQSLLQEVRQLTTSIVSPDRVSGLIAKFDAAHEAHRRLDYAGCPGLLSEVRAWVQTLQEFMRRMQLMYPLYRDLVLPFLAGISLMLSGTQWLAYSVQVWSTCETLLPSVGVVQETKIIRPLERLVLLIERLGCFPTVTRDNPTLLSLTASLIKDDLMPVLRYLQEKISDSKQAMQLTPRVLLIALKTLENHVLLAGDLEPDALELLSRMLSLFVTSWQHAEDARRAKEHADESIYKYRSTTHGDDLTEEQQEARELRRTFPSFEQDFDDITVGFTLDNKPDETPDDDPMEDDDPSRLSEHEMESVYRTHLALLPTLTRAPWLPLPYTEVATRVYALSKETSVELCMAAYSVASDVDRQAKGILSCKVDGMLVGSHLVACRALLYSVSQTHESQPEDRPYDVYRDANVPEVLQCRPLLATFRTSVRNLLIDWPDHPTLKQMVVVIDRIESFPVTSPLMKFVTGLEVLLNKAHEWETNAAHHVSLKAETEQLTHQIVQWRKHELKCWKRCLDTAAWKFRQRASRWWFHLYQLVEGALSVQPPTHDTQQPVMDDAASPPGADVAGIKPALQQFMESSPLGEYSTRLHLLKAFLCQLTHIELSEKRDEMVAVMWNVHLYYGQFEQQVAAELLRLRAPIEKELKGFVKIARWNDINFYSIKQAVEKTHQTLHKHIKSWEGVLGRPVMPILTDLQNDWNATQNEEAAGNGSGEVSMKAAPAAYNAESYITEERLKSLMVVQDALVAPRLDVQARLPDLFDKMRRHCSRVLCGLPYHARVTALNDFTGEVIDTVHDLQKDVLIQGPNKEKLLKDAKLLQVRKRKALSDLFKVLTQVGLSYRKGVLALSTTDPNRHLTARPVDITAMLTQLQPHRCDTETKTAWHGCQRYVLKCIARRALFRDALRAVSPELSKANIDRCQGFADDLLSLVHTQREELAQVANTFNQFRSNLWCLQTLAVDRERYPENTGLPSQDSVQDWTAQLRSLCVELLVGLHQMDIVLQCCPESPPEGHTVMSPLPTCHLPQMASMTQRDTMWTEVLQQIKSMQETVQSVKLVVDREVHKPDGIVSWTCIHLLKESMDKLHPLAESLHSIETRFRLPNTLSDSKHPLIATIKFLRERLLSQHSAFSHLHTQWVSESSKHAVAEDGQLVMFSEHVDELLTAVLVVVQDLVKEARAVNRQREEDKQARYSELNKDGAGRGEKEEDEEDASMLEDGHITEKLYKSLKTHINVLQMNKIVGKLVNIMETIRNWTEIPSTRHLTGVACSVLVPVVPVLIQYSHLIQAFLTHTLSTHRATAKLLSVLLSVFSRLATKGFCVPAELGDDMAGEGASTFEDIQDGGMGEGEGVKDVSDQIENEDQLDEARKAGEEKLEEKGNQPDVAPEDNAIEMDQEFDGKMHDREAQEGDENSEDEKDDGEEDMNKQMGDLGDEQADRLDEQVWGSDDEDDKEDEPKDNKDEFGPGAGEQTESEMVAKDDNQNAETGDDQKDKKKEEPQEQEEGDKKTKELNKLDEREYDEKEVDPHYGDQKQQEEPETMDLPDDLNLDEEEEQGGDDKDEHGEQENPLDLDKMTEGEEKPAEEGSEEKDGSEEAKMDTTQEEDAQGEQKGDDEDQKDKKDEKDGDKEEEMAVGEKEDGPPEGEPGIEPQLHPDDEGHGQEEEEGKDAPPEEAPQAAEMSGKTEHDTQQVQQVEQAHDAAGKNDDKQDEVEGTGLSEAQMEEGHEGDKTTAITWGGSQQPDQKQQSKRKPGQSNADRTVGTEDEKVTKRLKTVDRPDATKKDDAEPQDTQQSDLYEHVKDVAAHHDMQTTDVANADQQQATPTMDEDEPDDGDQPDDEIKPDDREQSEETMDVEKVMAAKLKWLSPVEGDGQQKEEATTAVEDVRKVDMDGQKVDTEGPSRGPTSTIHTDHEIFMDINKAEMDVEELRRHLEEELHTWHAAAAEPMATGDMVSVRAAQEAWQGYEALTATLSQELCEQLRLVLEPTQASKLRGDYRTGKRLNMRKVIPYIASQFRKDKIWLRRTKPSKRQYQVMVAVDDSSSMADNHSPQLAFESLAVVANALTLLEVGELGISSFGESVQLLHPFHEQFSNQSGARILQKFTFQQKKTNIAAWLHQMAAVMLEARGRQRGAGASETSQLLLVVSDGRGLFLEGIEVVRGAVRQAREANVFIVFVVIDNPDNKDSILDIRVPVFKEAGKMPEIKSYMDSFPFPFYIILRDINCLPTTLSDALRQWFELVTATDK